MCFASEYIIQEYMKILMINSVCGIRSTGRICTDLATFLEQEGNEIKIGFGREKPPIEYKKYAKRIDNEIDIKIHALKARLGDADGLGSIQATKKFIDWVDSFDPDIIHLHNLHGYYINVPLFFKYIINYNKKIIWTLHDTWAFSGHSGTCDGYNCTKWKDGCGDCPAFRGYPKSMVDRSNINYQWKKDLFTSVKNLTIVTPSYWLSNLVKESFLGEKKIVVIHNGINTKHFKRINSNFKKKHGIEDKILLMGCATWWDTSKGLNDFFALANKIRDDYRIVLVGLDKNQMNNLNSKIIGIERTNSVEELAEVYSAADLFINLSYADNYPTVNIEALACGTPVITYDTGGSSECLNGKNGKSFKQGDINEVINFLNNQFVDGIFDVSIYDELDKNFACKKYLDLYSDE